MKPRDCVKLNRRVTPVVRSFLNVSDVHKSLLDEFNLSRYNSFDERLRFKRFEI